MTEILGGLLWFSGLLALAGLAFATSISTPWTLRVGTLVQAAGVALATVGLVLYVQTEDSYRDNGMSRWDAYGAHSATVAAVILGCVAVVLLIAAWIVRRRVPAMAAFVVSIVAGFALTAATMANSVN